MLLEPAWTYTSRRPLTRWYGGVELHGDRVLGQWIALDRATGRALWERRGGRPNTVCGVDTDARVIVASEMRSDGPWTLDFGVYGLDLDDGRLLWTSHGRGWWGGVLRAFDIVPGFTNDLRDSPVRLDPAPPGGAGAGGEVTTRAGRVLDVRTGRLLRRLPPGERPPDGPPPSPTTRLTLGGVRTAPGSPPAPPAEVAGLHLRFAPAYVAAPHGRRGSLWALHADRPDGRPAWRLTAADLARALEDVGDDAPGGRPPVAVQTRLAGPRLDLLAAFAADGGTRRWRLLSADAGDGRPRVAANLGTTAGLDGTDPLGERWGLADADGAGTLLCRGGPGAAGGTLRYFPRD